MKIYWLNKENNKLRSNAVAMVKFTLEGPMKYKTPTETVNPETKTTAAMIENITIAFNSFFLVSSFLLTFLTIARIATRTIQIIMITIQIANVDTLATALTVEYFDIFVLIILFQQLLEM